jgi:hypothetical protein
MFYPFFWELYSLLVWFPGHTGHAGHTGQGYRKPPSRPSRMSHPSHLPIGQVKDIVPLLLIHKNGLR